MDLTFTEIASGLRFPEGPVAMADGSVMVVEIERGTLSRVRPDGSIEVVADCGGGPNSAAIGPDGAMYITNNGGCFGFIDLGSMLLPGPVPDSWVGGSIQRVDLDTGEVATLYRECNGRPLRAPNDLVFDSAGGFWFTDHGVRLERSSDLTGVFYAQPDGSSIEEVIFPLEAPNGVGLSPAEDVLYVAETHTGRVYRWGVPSPGTVSPGFPMNGGGTLLHGAGGGHLYDSMAIDDEGYVCVATLSAGGITVISPDGSDVSHHPTGDVVTTNICFGGEDMRTAFVTLSSTGRLVSTPWPRRGLRLRYNA